MRGGLTHVNSVDSGVSFATLRHDYWIRVDRSGAGTVVLGDLRVIRRFSRPLFCDIDRMGDAPIDTGRREFSWPRRWDAQTKAERLYHPPGEHQEFLRVDVGCPFG